MYIKSKEIYFKKIKGVEKRGNQVKKIKEEEKTIEGNRKKERKRNREKEKRVRLKGRKKGNGKQAK